MAGNLAAFRNELVTALNSAGLRADSVVPERIAPPAVFVLPRTPYVQGVEGGAMCDYAVNLRVVMIGPRGTNEAVASELDDTIELVCSVIYALELELEAVQEPVEIELNGTAYLGSVALVSGLVDLEE